MDLGVEGKGGERGEGSEKRLKVLRDGGRNVPRARVARSGKERDCNVVLWDVTDDSRNLAGDVERWFAGTVVSSTAVRRAVSIVAEGAGRTLCSIGDSL